MPQVSADVLVPWSLDRAQAFCRAQPALRVPRLCALLVTAWPMEGDGWAARPDRGQVRVIRRFGYTLRPRWLEVAVKPGVQMLLEPLVRRSLVRAVGRAGRP